MNWVHIIYNCYANVFLECKKLHYFGHKLFKSYHIATVTCNVTTSLSYKSEFQSILAFEKNKIFECQALNNNRTKNSSPHSDLLFWTFWCFTEGGPTLSFRNRVLGEPEQFKISVSGNWKLDKPSIPEREKINNQSHHVSQ